MRVKKAGRNIYGVELTAAEKKAMDIEIKRQLVEIDRQYTNDIDATILWQLHVQFGFGYKRLRRFYDAFEEMHRQLAQHYEMDESDEAWLCAEQLKRIGVDVAQWNKEKGL